ncbi:hypothetical protein TKK_0014016 [Trichogramma kaykai]|uniref:Uncharacterized protein n=1 Tax=Trichogramma kaykai TaxID=54128 RepID=A0ABD2WFQ4_9HYME
MPFYRVDLIITSLALLLLGHCATCLIVPEEIPSLLSLVYSNIPPIKKGTDSRLGVGFRFGEHADFQVLLELGPQFETDPIGFQKDTANRRSAVLHSAMNGELGPHAQQVAKHQVQRLLQEMIAKYKKKIPQKRPEEKISDNDWLKKWSKSQGVDETETSELDIVTSRSPLPVINRIRVVNAPTTP